MVNRRNEKYDLPPLQDIVEKTKEHYDLTIKPQDEKVIPIKAIYIYPVRGIRGIQVPTC